MGTLHVAMLSLFRAATLEDWTDLMYTSMYGCAHYGYDGMEHLCTHNQKGNLFAVLYWVSFIFLAAMCILNLFIGVITGAMEDAKDKLTKEMEEEAEADDAHFAAEGGGEVEEDDVLESEGEHGTDSSGGSSCSHPFNPFNSLKKKKEVKAPSYPDDSLGDQFQALAALFQDIASDIQIIQKDEDERTQSLHLMNEVTDFLGSDDEESSVEESSVDDEGSRFDIDYTFGTCKSGNITTGPTCNRKMNKSVHSYLGSMEL